jgi:hypothetical protein
MRDQISKLHSPLQIDFLALRMGLLPSSPVAERLEWASNSCNTGKFIVRHKTEEESDPPLHKEKSENKRSHVSPLAGKTGVQSIYSDPAYSSVDY